MKLYALSDLHLQADPQPFLFTDAKQAVFVRVADEALAADATLLLAGDVFDLTGMTQPRVGLDEFFRTLRVGVPLLPTHADAGAQVRALKARFPEFFAALARLAEKDRLWIIPGNHDFGVLSADGKTALAAALGVSTDRLRFEATVRVGRTLFAQHGHAVDPSNSSADCSLNRGSIITAVLYHAVTPALRELGVCDDVAYAVPCVRPEEKIVAGLTAHLGESRARKLLLALVNLLRVNGYFTGFDASKMWLASRLFTFLVTPERVQAALADDTKLAEQIRDYANAIADGKAATDPPGAAPSIVVMGHTHELDCTQRRYVNLGTWIDHVGGLGEADLARVDRSLPVLVIDDDGARLYDCLGLTGPVGSGRPLWTSPR